MSLAMDALYEVARQCNKIWERASEEKDGATMARITAINKNLCTVARELMKQEVNGDEAVGEKIARLIEL
jgi:hypothetical protein